jgi:hypothetical protein
MSTGQKAATTHPDENRLAAFAERALRGQEQRSMVAHLADCARCREIVFLAREAGAESELTGDKVAHSISAGRRWQIAVTAAASVALTAAALLIWHGRRLSVPSAYEESARTVTPGDKAPSPPAAKAPPAINPGSIAHESGTATTTGLQARNRQTRAASKKAPDRELAVRSRVTAPSSSPGGAGSNVVASAAEEPQTRAVSPVPLFSQVPPATMQPKPPSAARSESESVTVTAGAETSAELLSSDAATARSLVPSGNSISQFAIEDGQLRRWSASGFHLLPLPNGTKAKAVASSANIVLVLSRKRRVYRSTDLGEHWTEVPTQWQGKAAILQAGSAVPSGSYPAIQAGAGAGSSASVAPQAAPSASTPSTGTNSSAARAAAKPPSFAGRLASTNVTFVLTNTAGKRWISHDGGQTWLPE